MASRGAKPGERRGGRAKGVPNKATIAKLHDAGIVKQVAAEIGADKTTVAAVIDRAHALAGFRAKNELTELAMAMKNHLVQFQQAASATGMPGTKGYNAALWREVREWGKFYHELCDTVADFGPDARIKTVEFYGHIKTEDVTPPPKQSEKVHQIDDANAASRVYLRVVKGGKAA